MKVDLHTHTRASDGTQSPTELVTAAVAAGVDVLGVTDHDTAEGWDEAARAAAAAGLGLVRGMEVSTRLDGRGVHLLAYLPDPTYPPLVALLDKVLEGRSSRVPAVLARLREVDVELTEDDVARVSGDAAASGRPHIADALVVANTILAMSVDIRTRRASLGRVMGGLSGPAIKPIILRMAYQCVRAVQIPVIGCGGIMTAADALEYLIVGCRAVQVGTATFVHPGAMLTVIDGLEDYCRQNGIARIADLTGTLSAESHDASLEWEAIA